MDQIYSSNLLNRSYWDAYWNRIHLPQEIKNTEYELYLNEILNVFDKYLPQERGLSILEIGGAPGQYLAYMHREFGYDVFCLDYSDVGCRKTLKNFKILGIPIEVYCNDLFDENLHLPQFDIVYSLGFIEHFTDLTPVIEAHLKFLKPGGILLIGAPNFQGIYKIFLRKLAPKLLSTHNLHAMNINNWTKFEDNLNMTKIFKGYVGGFEPRLILRSEKKELEDSVRFKIAKYLRDELSNKYAFLRRFNSRYHSGYVMGVFQKTE